MSEQNNVITLYPSNWLYIASVIGFLFSVEEIEKADKSFNFDESVILINKNVFKF